MPRLFVRYVAWIIGFSALLWCLGGIVVVVVFLLDMRTIESADWRVVEADGYQLAERLKRLETGQYALSFGTSRSAQLSSKIVGEPLLNLNFVYGNPDVVAELLGLLSDRQWSNIRRIYFLVDLHTMETGEFQRDFGAVSKPVTLTLAIIDVLASMKFQAIRDAGYALWWNLTGTYPYYIHDDGFVVQTRTERYSGKNAVDDDHSWAGDTSELEWAAYELDGAVGLKSVKALADEHDVPVIFYTATLPDDYARAASTFLKRHMEAAIFYLDEIYVLARVPGLSDRFEFFSDETHLKAVGLKLLFSKDWAPYLVTKSTLSQPTVGLPR